MKDCTILVSSCDKYEDSWYPFFELLKIQWPDCPFDIVLSTETQKYECDSLNIKTVNVEKELSWTARLKYVLNQIDTEYVLFFLEDFFLQSPVKTEVFEKALEIIKSDDNIGLVHFTPVEKEMPIPENNLEECFYELPVRKRTLRTRVAVSLFRKEYFLKLLYKDENPWQYERESHIRSMVAGYKIYRQDYRLYAPAFHYTLDHSIGIGITAGKWLKNNKQLFESMGVFGVNYDRLGVLDDKEANQMRADKKDIKKVGFKEWFYVKFKQPIKRKIRHWWIVQDLLNFRKFIKYKKYYKNYK